jgi:hypothetical protein
MLQELLLLKKIPLCSLYLSLIPALNAQIKRPLTLETTLFRFSQNSCVIGRIAPYNNEEITSSNVEDDNIRRHGVPKSGWKRVFVAVVALVADVAVVAIVSEEKILCAGWHSRWRAHRSCATKICPRDWLPGKYLF